jgi:phosphoglycerate dehydrogenase-like enzyme
LKVVIVRKAPDNIQQLIAEPFPADWKIVTVSPEDLLNEVGDADALIPEGTRIDVELLGHAKNLKIIQTGAGHDNIDIAECTRKGICVANAAGVNARAVAEHVFALIFCWYKNINKLNAAMKSGRFAVDYSGSEISGKVIGVLGLGSIGREVVRMAQALNLEVIGYHYRPAETAADIDQVDLPPLLRRADIVTVHVALNHQTHHLIGKEEFELMKADAFFVNTSRGAVVDEQALIEALQTGQIGGAGLDVFETEPLPTDSLLRKLENVILTPHTAGEPDALFFHRKRFQFFADNIARVLNGKPPQNALNQPLGYETAPLIPEVILPEGYDGKILLVSVSTTGMDKKIILRSGDLWHHEILRNTEAEIRNLGFTEAQIYQLGGARLRFESEDTITIYGSSRQFGACDKEFAAELVQKSYPEKTVKVED